MRDGNTSSVGRFILPNVLLLSSLYALAGCTTTPSAPTAADIERGLNAPIVVQPSLGGRVTDAVTGAPVPEATVTVQGRSVSSSTTGHYGFDPNLTAGVFAVRVMHPQYVGEERIVEIKAYALADFKLQSK
jgi:hypothetical protein